MGNFSNIMIFHRYKHFQRNQCAFYLMVESMANFISLIIVVPFRITANVFVYDPTQMSLVWCKLRAALVGAFSIFSFFTISYAAIDQYLSTNCNIRLRQLSTLKLSHYLVYTSVIILSLYTIPFIIFYDLQRISGCIITNAGFAQFFSFVHFCVFSAVLPLTVSMLFAALAYINVRHIVRHQIAIIRRRLDRQLTAMVLAKVTFLVITTLPYVIFRIYQINTTISRNDLLRITIEQFITTVTSSVFNFNTAVCHIFRINFLMIFNFRAVFMYFFLYQNDFVNNLNMYLSRTSGEN